MKPARAKRLAKEIVRTYWREREANYKNEEQDKTLERVIVEVLGRAGAKGGEDGA